MSTPLLPCHPDRLTITSTNNMHHFRECLAQVQVTNQGLWSAFQGGQLLAVLYLFLSHRASVQKWHLGKWAQPPGDVNFQGACWSEHQQLLWDLRPSWWLWLFAIWNCEKWQYASLHECSIERLAECGWKTHRDVKPLRASSHWYMLEQQRGSLIKFENSKSVCSTVFPQPLKYAIALHAVYVATLLCIVGVV